MHTPVILLVEDDSKDVAMTLWAFEKSNVNTEIIVAHDGTEAMDLLLPADRPTWLVPAIVLLDITKPGPGGLEVLKDVRAHPATHNLPVIMLTGVGADSDVLAGYRLGANSCLAKPTNADECLTLATAVGAFWLGMNQPLPGR